MDSCNGNLTPEEKARQECAQAYVESIFSDFNQEMQFTKQESGQEFSTTKKNQIKYISDHERDAHLEQISNDYVQELFGEIQKI